MMLRLWLLGRCARGSRLQLHAAVSPRAGLLLIATSRHIASLESPTSLKFHFIPVSIQFAEDKDTLHIVSLNLTLGLGDIPVLQYYHDKYIHDNIITNILTYCDNRANDNTATTINTTTTKPLLAKKCSKLETSCLRNVVHRYYRQYCQYHKYCQLRDVADAS